MEMAYDWLKKKYEKAKGEETEKGEETLKRWNYDEWLDEINATVDPDKLFIYGEIIADSEVLTEAEKLKLLAMIDKAIKESYGRTE